MMKNEVKTDCGYLLSNVNVDEEVVVVDLKIQNQSLRRRLLEMGITKGVNLIVKRKAPLGSPISFEVRGYELGLRVDEARSIIVRLKK